MQYFVLESSPFLRCLETAAIIAREIGMSRIYVNYMLIEWMKGRWYPRGNPVGHLLVETMSPQEYSHKYLQGVIVDNF